MVRILVVDDEEQMLKLYYDILSKEGFEVLTAANGEDGLKVAKRELLDLVILDVMMPGMDGGQIARDLADNEKTKNIPVIFLTSIITEEEAMKRKGNIEERIYISKSSSSDEFIGKIKEVLNIKT